MTKRKERFFQRVLEPQERFAEVLFGVIMVLTFTVSLRVARADRLQVREMVIGALGCNLAWGLIDAIMYLMASVTERGHNIVILKAVRRHPEPEKANAVIADALPPIVAQLLPTSAMDTLRQKLQELPEPPAGPRLKADDWRGALGVFLLVFLSTFPIVLPFLVTHDIRLASHISDIIAISMLFYAGHACGRYAGHSPWGWGISMVVIGGLMVGLTIGLGG